MIRDKLYAIRSKVESDVDSVDVDMKLMTERLGYGFTLLLN